MLRGWLHDRLSNFKQVLPCALGYKTAPAHKLCDNAVLSSGSKVCWETEYIGCTCHSTNADILIFNEIQLIIYFVKIQVKCDRLPSIIQANAQHIRVTRNRHPYLVFHIKIKLILIVQKSLELIYCIFWWAYIGKNILFSKQAILKKTCCMWLGKKYS